jgi:hypothetical protein
MSIRAFISGSLHHSDSSISQPGFTRRPVKRLREGRLMVVPVLRHNEAGYLLYEFEHGIRPATGQCLAFLQYQFDRERPGNNVIDWREHRQLLQRFRACGAFDPHADPNMVEAFAGLL